MAAGALPHKVSLIQFPGSNCDWDCIDSLRRHFGVEVQSVWHTEAHLPKTDAVILPGGFSYGDYLRSGSIASLSPIMQAVRSHVRRGGAVIGICNGFQILTESSLLPGVLLKNACGRFVCDNEELIVADNTVISSPHLIPHAVLNIPIAHGEGRYYVEDTALEKLIDKGQILFRYVNNPNGATADIAGICSENGRVWGMMPHPERAMEELVGGSSDGLTIWRAFFDSCL